MQIDELVPPPVMSGYPVAQPDDPYVVDLLQLADERFVFFCDSRAASLAGQVSSLGRRRLYSTVFTCPS